MALWSLAARAGIPAARSALRFLSKLKKPSGGGITLYRGEPLKPIMSAKDTAKYMYGPGRETSKSVFSTLSNPKLRHSALGRWYTTDPSRAMKFAGSPRMSLKIQGVKNYLKNFPGWGYEPGIVKKVVLTPKQARLAKKVQERISGGDAMGEAYVIPRNLLPTVEKDAIRTAVANLKRMMGMKQGGLARILEV